MPTSTALPYASVQKAFLTNIQQSPGYKYFPAADTSAINQGVRRLTQGETAIRDTIPRQNWFSAGATAKRYWKTKPEVDSALVAAGRHFPQESQQASAYSVSKLGQGWNPVVRGPEPKPVVTPAKK